MIAELPNSSRLHMIEQSQTIIRSVLAPLVENIRSFVLLDYPDHSNVGDIAIWLGEIAYFQKALEKLPRYVCAFDNYDFSAIDSVDKTEPIFLHGGGNFGDIWPKHNLFREKIIERYPDRPIIQLPQTIHFASNENIEKAAQTINKHPNFTLLVRDQPSFEFAQRHFNCAVKLCPDMALSIGALEPPAPPVKDLVLLLREDPERQSGTRDGSELQALVAGAVDWFQDTNGRSLRLHARLTSYTRKLRSPNVSRTVHYYNILAESRFNAGIKLLSAGKFIITDRLHAYIIGTLLGIPLALIDNSYGKLSGYIAAWHTQDPPTVWKSLSDAVRFWNSSKP